MKKYFYNINFTIGFFITSLIFIIAFIGFFYTPYDINEISFDMRFIPPSTSHIMGTDNFGRDIFSRVIVGWQFAIIIGILSVSIGLFIGVLLGSISGYFGGILDIIVTKVVDILMAFPSILMALTIIAIFGSGFFKITLILGIMFIPRFTRITRASFLQEKEKDYVKFAKMMGASNFRIIFVHIFPNTILPIIVNITFSFGLSVITEASLSYLGLGIQPPNPSLGRMLNESQPFIQNAPYYTIFVGMSIALLVLGVNLLGDGINEVNGKG